MKKDLELSIAYPYKVYITVESTGASTSLYGQFDIKTKFKKFDPDAVDAGDSAAGGIVVRNSTRTVTVGK